MSKAQQLDPRCDGPIARRILKRAANRLMRRLGKLLLQDAPKRRPYGGYT